MKIKLPKDVAQSILRGDHETAKVVLNEIIDNGRWSIHYRLIFSLDGKLYETTYSKGATEYQEERPFEYDKEVECTEVEKYEKTVTDYREIK